MYYQRFICSFPDREILTACTRLQLFDACPNLWWNGSKAHSRAFGIHPDCPKRGWRILFGRVVEERIVLHQKPAERLISRYICQLGRDVLFTNRICRYDRDANSCAKLSKNTTKRTTVYFERKKSLLY